VRGIIRKEPPPKARDKIVYNYDSFEIENSSTAIAYEGVARATLGPWEKDSKNNWVKEKINECTLYQGVDRKKKELPFPLPYEWPWPPPKVKVPQEPKKVKRLIPLKLRVDRGKNRRYYLIKKNDQARYVYPMRQQKMAKNGYKRPRMKKKHKEIIKQNFWKLRFHELVVWELKKRMLDIDLCKREKEMEELLALPSRCDNHEVEVLKKHWWRLKFKGVMFELSQCTIYFLPQVVVSMNATATHSSTILDTGAMMDSGDANQSVAAQESRTPLEEPLGVRGVHGGTQPVTHKFVMSVPSAVANKTIELTNAIDIPGTGHNLVSVGLLDDKGCTTIFKGGQGKVYDKNDRLIMIAQKVDGLYRLKDELIDQCPQHVINYNAESIKRAHDIMGHRAFSVIRQMLNLPPESRECPNPVCSSCYYAKTKNNKNAPKEATTRAHRFGLRLHSDVSCKMPAATYQGQTGVQRYTLTGDEYTDSLYVDFGTRKSDSKYHVIKLVDRLNNKHAPDKIAEHQTDGGTEFINKILNKELGKRGVFPRNSTPHCQYQNGWIESRMEEIQNTSRAMMFRGDAPQCDWTYAVNHAVYLHDILPDTASRLTPYQKRTGLPPRVLPRNLEREHGILFCKCYAKVYKHGKKERDAVACIYLGKDPKTSGVLVRTIGGAESGKKVRSAQLVNFHLTEFPYATLTVPQPSAQRVINYNSDSEPEENGINVNDGDELKDSESDSEPETETDQEEEENCDRNLRSRLLEESKLQEDEPNDNSEEKDDGDEIEKIIGEKSMRGAGAKNKSKHYLVRWKKDQSEQYVPARGLNKPDLVQVWEIDKAFQRQTARQRRPIVQNLTMRVCQLNNEVEVKPESLIEENPFKKLFDPKYSKRETPPKGYKNMLKHVFAEHFQTALIREKMENQKWNTYKEVLRSEVPKNLRILKPVTAYDIKYNANGEIEKFKSRVCLDGSRTNVDPSETYEAVANTGTIRFLMCLAARYGLDIAQTDVRNFFLQAVMPPGKKYFAEIPDGWAENDPEKYVAEVLAPWYGLKESAKLAGDQLTKVYKKAGLEENPWMPKVFFKWKGDDFVCTATFVDDGIWIYSSRELLDEVLDAVDKQFKMTREYNVTKILGMEIEYCKKLGLMKIHQGSYNREKLKEMGFQNNKPAKSPGNIPIKMINPAFTFPIPQAPLEKVRRYQKKVGVQMWALQTDPSSMFVVHRLAKKMLNPQKEDWAEMDRLERYKNTFPEMGVVFRRDPNKEKFKKGLSLDCMTYYADADLAGDRQDAKSTTGYCVHLGESGMFDWKTKKQTCVCQSSCESEVYSSKECTCHAIWMRKALSFMGFTFTQPTPICQDNTSAIALCTSDKHHTRTRHFRMHVNLLKDNVRNRVTCYPWIPTEFMRGDLFNKAHGPTKHEQLCEMNDIYPQKIQDVPIKTEPLKIHDWAETVKQQKELAAAQVVT
tara:strand:+ start:457 stop:4788 length:4332 start_codon:yes stop_codon:yes gene_type:complete